MDSVLPMLVHRLDERDGAAKAVVKLVAEYCSLCSDNHCLQNVLKGLTSGNFPQRINAVDIISDLMHISLESGSSVFHQMWQGIADHLLQCLGDEELVIQKRTSALLPVIDPPLILPALVRVQSLVSVQHESVQSLVSEVLLAVLKSHKEEPSVLCLVLDCLGNLCNTSDLPDATGVA